MGVWLDKGFNAAISANGDPGRTDQAARHSGEAMGPFASLLVEALVMYFAGKGVRAGTVIGSTDPDGEKPPTDPVNPQDLFATLFKTLGVDTTREFYTPQGRPIRLNEGSPIARLLS